MHKVARRKALKQARGEKLQAPPGGDKVVKSARIRQKSHEKMPAIVSYRVTRLEDASQTPSVKGSREQTSSIKKEARDDKRVRDNVINVKI